MKIVIMADVPAQQAASGLLTCGMQERLDEHIQQGGAHRRLRHRAYFGNDDLPGCLLQRVEDFRGLAVLTTNARAAIDPAFLRRLRVVVSFPYPDVAARADLWRRAFPDAAPTQGLDPDRLASIDLPGGGIAAAALTAAYLGAQSGTVRPQDVATATGWELAKHGRSAAR